MNFLKVSIFFLYMKYITSILLLRKNISFQLRTILAFYFIMRIEVIVIYVKITRNDKLRPVVQSPKKTLPKRVPLYDRHVRNRVSLNCPRCFRRKCIENAFESSLSDITATRSTDSGSPELRLYYWDSPSFLQNYCYA